MCDNWRTTFFDNFSCSGKIEHINTGDLYVTGRLKTLNGQNGRVLFWAPAPPHYNSSYTGSGLPYANPLQAYEKTPNKGVVQLYNSQFRFKMFYPSGYYKKLGSEYVPPQIVFKLCFDGAAKDELHVVKLDDGIPYRTLTVPKNRKDVSFYGGKRYLPIRTQEAILRDSSYPKQNIMPKNFWGLKPPH